MTFASIFVLLFACNIINVCSIEHVLQNRTEVNNNQKDISFDFNCNGATDNNETCSVTLNMEKTLQEVTDQFSNLIKDHNATLVRFWLKFPEYEGFNPMLVNTSHAYGLWLWHWLYDEKGKSLLLLPHTAEFYSFGTLFLRGPNLEIMFRGYDNSSREIASLPECCKLGLAARIILKITNSSVNNVQKDSNHLCHRYVDKPDTDDAKVQFRCCHVVNWDEEDDCHEQIEENKWIKSIAISGVILTVVLWVFVLPVACWYIMPAAITEQWTVWKMFRRNSDDTCRNESNLIREKVIYRKEEDLLAHCTSRPVTIATISKFWKYPSQKPGETLEDSRLPKKRKGSSKYNTLFKRLAAVAYFVLVVPICVILLVIIGPIFLGFTDIEVKAWTMSTGFTAPNYEWALFMPYPFETWRFVTVCTLYATYSLACAIMILMFGDTLGVPVCLTRKLRFEIKSRLIEDWVLKDFKEAFPFNMGNKYEHFLRTVQKSVKHLFVNALFLIKKAQIVSLTESTQTRDRQTHSPSLVERLWQTRLKLFTRLPPITFFILLHKITKVYLYYASMLMQCRQITYIFQLSFSVTVILLAYFIMLISLWVILFCFGFTLMGIALNPDKVAPVIVVALTIFGYVLSVYYSFVRSYEKITNATFEILLSKVYSKKNSVEYVGDSIYDIRATDECTMYEIEDEGKDLETLVFRNVVFAQSATRENCTLKDTLCFVFNKIQPVRHELGFALIKLSSLVAFIIFAFFVIRSFGVNPALQTALTAIVGAVPAVFKARGADSNEVPAVFKARGADSNEKNERNDLLSCEIECALHEYIDDRKETENEEYVCSESGPDESMALRSISYNNS